MMEMKEFQEKLVQIIAKANEQEKNLTKTEILDVFGMGQLSPEQLQSLYQYLKLQGISIEGMELQEVNLETTEETEDSEMEEIPLEEEDEACWKEYQEYVSMQKPEAEGEREAILTEWKIGNAAVMERMTQIYLADILDMARSLYRKGIYLFDLIQEGNMSLLLMEPSDMPEDNRDVWVKEGIRNRMKAWISEQMEEKEKDNLLVEKVRNLEQAIKDLSDEDDAKFSVEELSMFLDMKEEEIRAVLSLTSEGTEE